MSDDSPARPRRGLPAVSSEDAETDVSVGTPDSATAEDTAAPNTSSALAAPRRGVDGQALEPLGIEPPQGDAAEPGDAAAPHDAAEPQGAAESDTDAEPDAAPEADADPDPEPVNGAHIATPASTIGASRPPGSSRHIDMAAPHRSLGRQLLPYGIGGLVLALAAGGVTLAVHHHDDSGNAAPSTSTSASASASDSASPSSSASATPAVDVAHLVTPGQAESLKAGSRWSIAETLSRVTATSRAVACLAPDAGGPAPTATIERTLTASGNGPAALHRIDGFASAQQAQAAFGVLRGELGSCTTTPLYLVGTRAVKGLGDEAIAVTVADQEQTTTAHTIVLARTGTMVDSLDIAQSDTPIDPQKVTDLAAQVVAQQCRIAGGSCRASPALSIAPPVPGPVKGWLGTADLPRITPAQGLWSSTDPGGVGSTGIPCEGINLSTVAGPTARQRRTYLLTQDASAPTNFGVDEIVLTLPDAAKAAAMATQLSGNLAGCATSIQATHVSQVTTIHHTAAQTGSDAVTGRSMVLQLPTTTKSTVQYRAAVVSAGSHVIYLLANQADTFGLSAGQIDDVAVRAAQRAAEVH